MKEKRLAAGGPGLAALAFANCAMILENAIVMPDKYINEVYGSDAKMCKVAEQYFDLGVRILRETPEDFPVEEITIGRTDGREYVPGLIQCKDCRYWHPEDGDCEEMVKLTGALDYRSFGLSKEDDQERILHGRGQKRADLPHMVRDDRAGIRYGARRGRIQDYAMEGRR